MRIELLANHETVKNFSQKIIDSHGIGGFPELVKKLVEYEMNTDEILTADVLRTILRQNDVLFTLDEFQRLVNVLDVEQNNTISLVSVRNAILAPLSNRSKRVAEIALQKLFGSHDSIAHEVIRTLFDEARAREFNYIESIVDCLNPDSYPVVTKDEFLAYYAGVCFIINNDDKFETLLIRSWNLDKPKCDCSYFNLGKQLNKESNIDQSNNPLYQTTYSVYGSKANYVNTNNVSMNRPGAFTKNYFGPPRNTGLNVSMTKPRYI